MFRKTLTLTLACGLQAFSSTVTAPVVEGYWRYQSAGGLTQVVFPMSGLVGQIDLPYPIPAEYWTEIDNQRYRTHYIPNAPATISTQLGGTGIVYAFTQEPNYSHAVAYANGAIDYTAANRPGGAFNPNPTPIVPVTPTVPAVPNPTPDPVIPPVNPGPGPGTPGPTIPTVPAVPIIPGGGNPIPGFYTGTDPWLGFEIPTGQNNPIETPVGPGPVDPVDPGGPEVPEPSVYVLTGTGLLALAWLAKNRGQ